MAKAIDIKIKLIGDINDILVSHGKSPLTAADFDILYDLDIDQLITTKHDITNVLIGHLVNQ